MAGTTTYQTGSANIAVTWRWTCRPPCVRLARSQLRKTLARWGLGGIEEPAVLVLSELVTNAMRHARAPQGQEIRTRFVRQSRGAVRLEVEDTADEWPVPRVPDDSGGYGLLLVEQLAESWGVTERDGPGKCVWAVIIETDGGDEHAVVADDGGWRQSAG